LITILDLEPNDEWTSFTKITADDCFYILFVVVMYTLILQVIEYSKKYFDLQLRGRLEGIETYGQESK